MDGLPREAACWREEVGSWELTHELVAQLVERTDVWWRMWLTANGAKKGKLPPPPDIQHPDRRSRPVPMEREITRDPVKIRRFFETA